MAIKPLKLIERNDRRTAIIANAVGTSALTVAIGDTIIPGATGHTKYVTNATTTSKILGIVTALYFQGKVMELTSVVGVNTASTAAGASQVNVHNDNETTGYWSVEYIPSFIPMEYEADLSAATVTTDGNGLGAQYNIVSGTPGQLLESSAVIWSGTANQFTSRGITDYSTSKVRAIINQSFQL